MTALLEAGDLKVRRGTRQVLNGFSLTVQPGEILALVGPNGSGKSTALRVLVGALTPDSGSVLYDGKPAASIDPLTRARFVAYLPQEFHSYWDLTVDELLRLGATRGDGFGWLTALHRNADIPEDLVREFELADLLQRSLATLSGGERGRAALAAAVAGRPRLLLADEPIANLDIAHQLRLMRLLAAMKAKTGAVIVIHDLNLAGRFADRIAVLEHGRVVACDAAASVLALPIVDRVFETDFERRPAPWGPLLVAR